MSHGKGVIGYASHYLGRYREFDQCLTQLKYPEGSIVDPQIGMNVALHFNNMIRTMLREDYEWVWILGDDHVFNSNLLMNLLDHDVDVVIPLCLTRCYPYKTVIYQQGTIGNRHVGDDFLNGKEGLLDITNYACGNAGMLIKRHVADAIDSPWFENNIIDREFGASDLVFSEKIKVNGFKLFIDTDSPLGHITHMAVWPTRDKEFNYSAKVEHIHKESSYIIERSVFKRK